MLRERTWGRSKASCVKRCDLKKEALQVAGDPAARPQALRIVRSDAAHAGRANYSARKGMRRSYEGRVRVCGVEGGVRAIAEVAGSGRGERVESGGRGGNGAGADHQARFGGCEVTRTRNIERCAPRGTRTCGRRARGHTRTGRRMSCHSLEGSHGELCDYHVDRRRNRSENGWCYRTGGFSRNGEGSRCGG